MYNFGCRSNQPPVIEPTKTIQQRWPRISDPYQKNYNKGVTIFIGYVDNLILEICITAIGYIWSHRAPQNYHFYFNKKRIFEDLR
jgi:hypothetical protein